MREQAQLDTDLIALLIEVQTAQRLKQYDIKNLTSLIRLRTLSNYITSIESKN